MAYTFREYRLDIKRRELRRGDELVALEPQVLDLLIYLVRHRDQVVSKQDILDGVWAGRIVSDSALTTRINAVRRAIGDNGARQLAIRTLPRKGFRFVGEVNEISDDRPIPPLQPSKLGDTPSIAVLPFADLSADASQTHLADSAVEQIIAALCRLRWLSVIARSSWLMYRGQAVDPKRVGRELGVRYLLEGSVRKGGDRVRITAQLIDTETRTHLWADWCEGTSADFGIQDRAAAMVAAGIEPVIEIAETRRAAGRPDSELEPHDLYLRALPGCYAYSARPLLQACELLAQAVERNPELASALAAAAGCRQFLAAIGWAEDPEQNRIEAVRMAQQALQLENNDPGVLAEAARVLGYFTDDLDSAILLAERAVSLNPNHARGWYWNGWLRLFAGQPDLAMDHFQTALRLNPHYRICATGIGVAHLFGRRYSEAVKNLSIASYELPEWPTTHRFLAASYAHLGHLKKAQTVVNRLREIVPGVAVASSSAFRNHEHSALYANGLRAALGTS